MKNQAKISIALLAATVFVMALMAGPALAIEPPPNAQLNLELTGMPPIDSVIGDPPYENPIGDPPKEPPTVIETGGSEGPCIDGYKEVTSYTNFSDGTAISSIALVPCEVCTPTGETWMENCNTCYIDTCGVVHCTLMLCGPPGDTPDTGDEPGLTPEPEPQPAPGPTPAPVIPPVTASSLPHTGANLALLALAGAILMTTAGAMRFLLRKTR